MNYLVDTHILLWALTNDVRLPASAKEILLDKENMIFYSFANVWEIAIKHALKKPDMTISPEEFDRLCFEAGYFQLELDFRHAYAVSRLNYDGDAAPRSHRDPFDRLLLAQAKVEQMKFLTHDELLPYYHEPCVVSV